MTKRGPEGVHLLQFGRGQSAANPIQNEMDLMIALLNLCGAEGMRLEGNTVIALRFDTDGNEIVIDRFELTAVNG